MQVRTAWTVRFTLLILGAFAALTLTRGQEQPSSTPLDPAKGKAAPFPAQAPKGPTAEKPAHDFSNLPALQRQVWLSAQRGAEWLYRANGPDGRFTYGIVPALRTALEGDHYLRQVAAAATLARVARFCGDQRYAARATQAIVTLLTDTSLDAQNPQLRFTVFPPATVNRLAAAGLLVAAIHELPEPDKDLLAKGEQLCNYIRKQQQSDGSLAGGDSAVEPKSPCPDADAADSYPGMALYGLVRSIHRQPAPWKTDLIRNALVYYKASWRHHKSMAFVPWQTAAFTEAYLLTKEQAFADFVFEMNDWICSLQYQGFDDPKQVYWSGGFKSWAEGKAVETPPHVGSSCYAESLAEACRVARAVGDLNHHKSYTAAVERCLPFLTTLQYTEANTQHFADWYRSALLGGFHASHQDGNLRLDYTQQAVSAMAQYLVHVARVP